MRSLSDKQKSLLEFLLDSPAGASLDSLAAHLGITKSGAKEHVIKLQTYGYISFQDVHGSVGRPRRLYSISAEGQEVFPRQYSWLSNVLLELLSDQLGPRAIAKIMGDLAKRVADTMSSRFAGKDPKEILVEVTAALNELGYRSALKQTDVRKGAVIEATNCVYHTVALEHPELCRFDVQFLQHASGMTVKLEKCIARGDSVCRFCLRKK